MLGRRSIERQDALLLGKLIMAGAALFTRKCNVIDPGGNVSDLPITFCAPEEKEEYGGYLAIAEISCDFFSRSLSGLGEDQAQAFFWLPKVVTAYLIGQRRFGFEAYWTEPGDLDSANFWT